ncbi:uncharacterized protein LOC129612927 [Condylostylus longicornis]|uniref:uncharacterized protein LOC129612927 n=1 Tax=Condylostylus longicornis TaxID=2530218 RepID=UPI00244DE94E|nr:uncharacterized protein LOC129612927 [Condylostylus longicornis]XP_055382749.1 uncharacterized protein LOC129612927 [Condylostylus longicornis]
MYAKKKIMKMNYKCMMMFFVWVMLFSNALGTNQVDINDVLEGENIKLICEFGIGFQNEKLNIIWEYPNMKFNNNNLRINYTTEFINVNIVSTVVLSNAQQINHEGSFICKLYLEESFITEKYFNIKFMKTKDGTIEKTLDITIIILIVVFSIILFSIIINFILWGLHIIWYGKEKNNSNENENENV